MKNLRLGIFVVGTTMMLWLGCSTYTFDDTGLVHQDQAVTGTEFYMHGTDSTLSENVLTFDELDEDE